MRKPIVLLIDGCSASGKSSFKNALLTDERFNFRYVKRYTTRAPRPDDEGNDDYIFISQSSFDKMVLNDEFAEYRRYLFGMAYGLRTEDVLAPASRGQNVLGLMNLGAVDMARASLPMGIFVLIDAPIRTIEQRLRARNYHSEEQIEERLQNARTTAKIKHKYDYVCLNDNGSFDQAYQGLISFLEGI